jgi:hypothetical protein
MHQLLQELWFTETKKQLRVTSFLAFDFGAEKTRETGPIVLLAGAWPGGQQVQRML